MQEIFFEGIKDKYFQDVSDPLKIIMPLKVSNEMKGNGLILSCTLPMYDDRDIKIPFNDITTYIENYREVSESYLKEIIDYKKNGLFKKIEEKFDEEFKDYKPVHNSNQSEQSVANPISSF